MPGVIYNSLKDAALDVISASDPTRLLNVTAKQSDALTAQFANQMNAQRVSFSPPMMCVDLEKYIVEIIIETTTQGSSFLEVHLEDPYWVLLRRDKNGAAFFDVDTDGFLWPPIEIQFPTDTTDQSWVLCQLRPSTDMSGPNIVLTFEDKIVAECRQHDNQTDPSLTTSGSNETRAAFIKRCVTTAVPKIRFIPLLRMGSPTAFTAADLTAGEKSPKSSKHGRDHKKAPGIGGTQRSGTIQPLATVGTTLLSIADGITTGATDFNNPSIIHGTTGTGPGHQP